jgi:divalent metal cation (Fe/Co/Zn/Cd) transporter
VTSIESRSRLLRRGVHLAWATIAWNVLEGLLAVGAGVFAGSIALIGFGGDSYVEVFAGAVVLWRLRAESGGRRPSEEVEDRARRLIALSFLVLASAITVESVRKLAVGSRPEESPVGIAIAIASLVVMPLLALAKRRVGEALSSRAVLADAAETLLCTWLSAALLTGLVLNALWGWWWADPAGGLAIALLAAREGVEHWGGEDDHQH